MVHTFAVPWRLAEVQVGFSGGPPAALPAQIHFPAPLPAVLRTVIEAWLPARPLVGREPVLLRLLH